MRVLVLIPALGAAYGGPSRIATDLAAALGRRGVDVDVIATNADGPSDAQEPVDKWIEQVGFRIRYFPRWGHYEFKFSPQLFHWLIRNLNQYDLVHIISLFSFPVLAAALACRLRRVPYLINPQGMLEPWALRHKAWKKKIYYLFVERPVVLSGAALLHAVNRIEAHNLIQLRLGVSVIILTNGVDAVNIDCATPEPFLTKFQNLRGRRLVLFLHRVDPKKGLDILALSYARIRSEFPDTHIIVAGPDNVGFAGTAKALFRTAGLSEAVTFTGMLEGEMKAAALAAASVFVAPSYSEGFSMSVLEAMAAGLPCVLTEGCNFPEAAEAKVARITAIDSAAFSEALADLLRDQKSAAEMGARGRHFVMTHYTWDRIAAEMLEVYLSLKRDSLSSSSVSSATT